MFIKGTGLEPTRNVSRETKTRVKRLRARSKASKVAWRRRKRRAANATQGA